MLFLHLHEQKFNIMLRIKEQCKKKGITQAELAKKMKISASALAQSMQGNPTLDRLEAIAEALNISVGELFPEYHSELNVIALHGTKHYKAESLDELYKITKQITLKQVNENRMDYRINLPYGMIFDLENNKAELFNREYQLLGETKGTDSVFTMELRDMQLDRLSEDILYNLFESRRFDKGRHIGFFYSDKSNPFCERETASHQLNLLEYYNSAMYILSQNTNFPNYSLYER